MGDIARELILLGADGTYTQVHNRVRTWRLRGKLPEPDASVGDTPYWMRATITDWLTDAFPLAKWVLDGRATTTLPATPLPDVSGTADTEAQ